MERIKGEIRANTQTSEEQGHVLSQSNMSEATLKSSKRGVPSTDGKRISFEVKGERPNSRFAGCAGTVATLAQNPAAEGSDGGPQFSTFASFSVLELEKYSEKKPASGSVRETEAFRDAETSYKHKFLNQDFTADEVPRVPINISILLQRAQLNFKGCAW